MSERPIHERIAEQFSYRGERADVWRAFDRFLDTDAYLNLGYSPWYLPHVVGSSQRRLARVVGDGLADRLGATSGLRLLDVGCGRGGPATVLAREFGFDVLGVDLVRYNVAAARRNAARDGASAEFVVGDAARLPVATDAASAAASIDALGYVPGGRAALEELARVVRPGGVVAVSTLVARDGLDPTARACVDAFADAWDMAEVVPAARHGDDLAAAGLVAEERCELGPHNIDRFRKWTRLYLELARWGGGPVDRLIDRWDLDSDAVTEQVRLAHDALPYLRHVLVYARVE